MLSKPGDLVTLVAVGDVWPRRENPESLFALSADVIRRADIAFCQLEAAFSDRESRQVSNRLCGRCAPAKNVSALTFAGFDIVSFATNHCFHWGEDAFYDTLALLKANNIAVAGAGANVGEARRPAVIERKGTRVAFLAYNSVLAPGYAAAYDMPGCAPIRVSTSYEQIDRDPGTAPRVITLADRADLEAMIDDIGKVRPAADVVIVSQHSGVHHAHGVIAMYQKEIAHAAIDAGADLVLQHHAHALKGIELYKGKVVFYGLGCFAHEAARGHMLDNSDVKRHHDLYGIEVDPEWKLYPFPAYSRNTIIAKVDIADRQLQKVSFLPCLINKQVQAEVLPREDSRSLEVMAYMEDLCRVARFDTMLSWLGNEVLVWEQTR